MREYLLRAITVLISLLVGLLLGEMVLRWVFHPGDYLHADLKDDDILGHRIEPYGSGHDAWGFRNYSVPQQSSIVAIGDSQTYGVSTNLSKSWPFQLHEILKVPVYNMGLGGYGPLEYFYLLKNESYKLSPEMVIIGLYLGNDISDAYTVAHSRKYWSSYRHTEQANDNEAFIFAQADEGEKAFSALRRYLSIHSVLYNILRDHIGPLIQAFEARRLAEAVSRDERFIWTDPENSIISTIFTPQYRLKALNLDSERIKEGLEITKDALEAIYKARHDWSLSLLVVLIPTKENVYCDYLKHHEQALPESLLMLCDMEDQVREELINYLIKEDISYLDVRNAMQSSVEKNQKLYKRNADGHPALEGYRVIAEAIASFMRSKSMVP